VGIKGGRGKGRERKEGKGVGLKKTIFLDVHPDIRCKHY